MKRRIMINIRRMKIKATNIDQYSSPQYQSYHEIWFEMGPQQLSSDDIQYSSHKLSSDDSKFVAKISKRRVKIRRLNILATTQTSSLRYLSDDSNFVASISKR